MSQSEQDKRYKNAVDEGKLLAPTVPTGLKN